MAACGAGAATNPVIGYLSARSPDNSADIIAAFRQGLNQAGFSDGQNVSMNLVSLTAISTDCLGWRLT